MSKISRQLPLTEMLHLPAQAPIIRRQLGKARVIVGEDSGKSAQQGLSRYRPRQNLCTAPQGEVPKDGN